MNTSPLAARVVSPRQLRFAAAGLALGAIAFGAGDLVRRMVEPAKTDTASMTTAVHDHAGAWTLAGLLAVASALLLLAGVAAAGRSVTGRGAALTVLGSGLTVAGLLGSLIHTAGYYGFYGVYAKSGADAGAIHAIDSASGSYPLFGVGIGLFMVGMLLGPILLTIGLRRAGVVPVWVPIAAVVFAVSSSVNGAAAGVVGLIAALLTFGAIGMSLVRRPAANGGNAAAPGAVAQPVPAR
jgi:hypothetical protein